MADGSDQRDRWNAGRPWSCGLNGIGYKDVDVTEGFMQDLGEEENEQETGKQNGTLNLSRYIIGGLCLVLFLALTGVGYVQVEERRGGGLRPFVSAENKRCIDCHMAKD